MLKRLEKNHFCLSGLVESLSVSGQPKINDAEKAISIKTKLFKFFVELESK